MPSATLAAWRGQTHNLLSVFKMGMETILLFSLTKRRQGYLRSLAENFLSGSVFGSAEPPSHVRVCPLADAQTHLGSPAD